MTPPKGARRDGPGNRGDRRPQRADRCRPGATAPSPPFEVVSIKPNSALDRSGMISSPAGSQLRVSNSALRMIINYAYKPRTCSRRFRNNSG